MEDTYKIPEGLRAVECGTMYKGQPNRCFILALLYVLGQLGFMDPVTLALVDALAKEINERYGEAMPVISCNKEETRASCIEVYDNVYVPLPSLDAVLKHSHVLLFIMNDKHRHYVMLGDKNDIPVYLLHKTNHFVAMVMEPEGPSTPPLRPPPSQAAKKRTSEPPPCIPDNLYAALLHAEFNVDYFEQQLNALAKKNMQIPYGLVTQLAAAKKQLSDTSAMMDYMKQQQQIANDRVFAAQLAGQM